MSLLTPSIDSRKIVNPSKTRFYAIHGARNDGHEYIPFLYDKGVRNFVIERNLNESNFPEAQFESTESTIQMLQADAIQHRSQFDIPVVGITGSNGKTIIKEWLGQLLEDDESIVKSPGSYNSQVGVPLSIFEMREFHTLAIFEAGVSKPNEMEKLQSIIDPTFGIFSNIGSAHDSGFQSTRDKIEEKLQLFQNCKRIIFHRKRGQLAESIDASKIPTLSWSFEKESDDCDLTVKELSASYSEKEFQFTYKGELFHLIFPFTNAASIENLMHCVAFLVLKSYPSAAIQSRINRLKPVSMRLEVKKAKNNCYVIDDSYNNDLGGLQIALNFLEQNNQRVRRTVILSDVYQSGLDDPTLYAQISEMLASKKVNRVIGIGSRITKHSHLIIGPEVSCFKSTEHFLSAVVTFKDEIILVKGARDFQFEQIVKNLTYQQHRTVLEINLEALVSNLNFYRSFLQPETKVMVMVKAFAYGGGSFEIANLLQYQQVDYLAVAYADEGVELRKNGIHIPIMVMNPTEEDFINMVDYHLEPELYAIGILHQWIQFVNLRKVEVKIHLKIDSGMHRLGFENEHISDLISALKNSTQKIPIASLFTHLATADDIKTEPFVFEQITTFKGMCNEIEHGLGIDCMKHILNSSGILNFPEMQMDMVRLGIGLYGIDPSARYQDNLDVATTLKSIISQIKNVKAGQSIGYSRAGMADKDMKIATIAIGYADGLNRRLSQGVGSVYINGRMAPIVGNVCMDMIMVDISKIKCIEGDEVEIFGANISIQSVAEKLDSISYEVLTSVSERVKRVYYQG